jgi:hypothetical protein
MANPSNSSPLGAYDWRVNRRDENPMLAGALTAVFDIAPNLAIVVTNRFSDCPVDTWLILERHKTGQEDCPRVAYSFVSTRNTQTEAYTHARLYAWAIWRFDIALQPFPY